MQTHDIRIARIFHTKIDVAGPQYWRFETGVQYWTITQWHHGSKPDRDMDVDCRSDFPRAVVLLTVSKT